jgi:hypothetical protein
MRPLGPRNCASRSAAGSRDNGVHIRCIMGGCLRYRNVILITDCSASSWMLPGLVHSYLRGWMKCLHLLAGNRVPGGWILLYAVTNLVLYIKVGVVECGCFTSILLTCHLALDCLYCAGGLVSCFWEYTACKLWVCYSTRDGAGEVTKCIILQVFALSPYRRQLHLAGQPFADIVNISMRSAGTLSRL